MECRMQYGIGDGIEHRMKYVQDHTPELTLRGARVA